MAEPIDIGAKRQSRQERAEAKASKATRPPAGEPRTPKPPPPPPAADAGPVLAEQVAKKRTPADRKLATSIASTYQMIGMGAVGIGMRLDDQGIVGVGANTVNMAEGLAEAWLDVADANPKVKRALQKFTEVSAAGALVGMHFAVVLPLLIDRNIIPGDLAGMMANQAAGAAQNGNGAHN